MIGNRSSPQRAGTVRARFAIALALVASATSACDRGEITHFRVPKAPGPATAASAPGVVPASTSTPPEPRGGPAEMAGEVPAPPRPAGSTALRWTLPNGWKEAVAGGMRYATLTPATPGRVEVSVVVLSGAAGGELANVNRWRGQIGLPPLGDGELAAARQRLDAKAGPVNVYDFTSDGTTRSRVVAGLTSTEGNTWFIKMSGDAGPVGAAKPEFIRLLESLRLEGT